MLRILAAAVAILVASAVANAASAQRMANSHGTTAYSPDVMLWYDKGSTLGAISKMWGRVLTPSPRGELRASRRISIFMSIAPKGLGRLL